VIDVLPDHVRLVVEVDPQYGVHRLVKAVKGRTSAAVKNYVEQQKSR